MSGNDFRGEQEPAELARLLPVPAARDLPAGRQRILQEHLMTELHPMEPKSPPRAAGQRRKRRYGLVAVAGSAAVAAAVAVTVFTTGSGTPGSPGSAQASGAPTRPRNRGRAARQGRRRGREPARAGGARQPVHVHPQPGIRRGGPEAV